MAPHRGRNEVDAGTASKLRKDRQRASGQPDLRFGWRDISGARGRGQRYVATVSSSFVSIGLPNRPLAAEDLNSPRLTTSKR